MHSQFSSHIIAAQDFDLSAELSKKVLVLVMDEEQSLKDALDLFASSELSEAALAAEFELKAGSVERKSLIVNSSLLDLVVAKLKNDQSIHDMHKQLRQVYKQIKELKASQLSLLLAAKLSQEQCMQLLKRFELENSKFDLYKTSGVSTKLDTPKEEAFELNELKVYSSDSSLLEAASSLVKEASILASSISNARLLVNQPANVMTPSQLAKEAERLAKHCGFEIEVHGPDWIQEQGLKAYWQVAKGSEEEPRFIIMRYNNAAQSSEKLALVGKGMCYDSGGYAIKPANHMNTMMTDMAGSAAVINTMAALASAQAQVNVVAIVAACENMISGRAYRNGDIIGSYAGKYIEVANTDAEGRLTLADAVSWAWKNEGATKIVDIATLTGAVIVSLGYHYTGVLADDEGLWQSLEQASHACGDKVWRLPVDDEYAAQNKSKLADIKNTGGMGAGTITAGHFVRAFAGEKPFCHIDIAATSWLDAEDEYNPFGGTGVGTELLYHMAKEVFKA